MSNRASRDDGLKRVSNLTRWLAGASIVIAGVFSVATARAAPGRSQPPSKPAGDPTPNQGTPAVTDGGSSQGDSGLVPPALPPAPASGSGSVTSGAS
jgi:hypothetical protein